MGGIIKTNEKSYLKDCFRKGTRPLYKMGNVGVLIPLTLH